MKKIKVYNGVKGERITSYDKEQARRWRAVKRKEREILLTSVKFTVRDVAYVVLVMALMALFVWGCYQ